MKIRKILMLFFSLFAVHSLVQAQEMEDRTIFYYQEKLSHLIEEEMIAQKILLNSTTISDEYKDPKTNRLTREGKMKAMLLRVPIYESFFTDALYYLQKVTYKDDVYALYFTLAGFDDISWYIIKTSKADWQGKEKLSQKGVEQDNAITTILWNYDEDPKNTENTRLFIRNHYLVMERGNLYHALFDLDKQEVLVNKESPWAAALSASGKLESGHLNKEEMNQWIKENLHDKIAQIIDAETASVNQK